MLIVATYFVINSLNEIFMSFKYQLNLLQNDKNMLLKWIPKVKKIVTVEENVLAGGFGSSILEFTSDNFPKNSSKISRIGLPDKFIEKYGTQE